MKKNHLNVVYQPPGTILPASVLRGCATPTNTVLNKGSSAQVVRIMPLGDSITYDNRRQDMRPVDVRIAYRYELHRLLNSAGYVFGFVGSEIAGERYLGREMGNNAGFPGITTHQLARLVRTGYSDRSSTQITPGPYLETYPADIILLHIGTNGLEPSSDGVRDVLDSIRASDPDVYIIVARIIDRYPHSEVTGTFNDNVEAMVKARNDNRITLIDMERGAGFDYSTDMADDLHPNDLGYRKMAAVWYEALTNLKISALAVPDACPAGQAASLQPRPHTWLSRSISAEANFGATNYNVDNISVVETGGTPCPEMDLNDDCALDWLDVKVFVESWLNCNRNPTDECLY
jgi:lysophospholipase L1-like esterase